MALSLQRNHTIVLAILLAVVAILSAATPSTAQQSSSAPAAPVLTAQAGPDAIALSWETVPGAARYELWTRPRNGEWLQLDDGKLTATSFRHANLTAATTYYYQILAVNQTGERSEWSRRVSATFAGSLVAPALMVQVAGGAFQLSWPAVAGALAYEIWERTDAYSWQQLGGAALTATSYRPYRTCHRYDLLLCHTRSQRC